MTTIQAIGVGKDTGTYADVLLAVGAASLLHDLAREAGHAARITITDMGGAYLVRSETPIDLDRVVSIGPGYRYLLDKASDPQRPESGSGYFDYLEEKKRRDAAKQAAKQRKAAGMVEADRSQEPSPDLTIFSIFNKLRSGSPSYNKMHTLLRRDAARLPSACVRYLPALEDTASLMRLTEPWEEDLEKASAALQFFNPIIGKGVHRPKPDGTGLSGYNGRTHWFEQWLRLRGFDAVLLAYWTNDNKDVKVLVPAPGHIDYAALVSLRNALLEKRLWGNQRLDCETALSLGEELIKHSEYIIAGGSSPRLASPLNQVVKGLASAYFKSLGAGLALTNVSLLGLPGWLPVTRRDEASTWLGLIDEHHHVVRRLREDHSDEVGLLLQYREFLSSGQLVDALEFFSSYAAHLLGTDSVPSFSVANVGRLFMSYDNKEGEGYRLARIIEDPGFQAIATAVRRSTVIEQYRKAKDRPQEYEIRYGLAQEWKRKAKFRDEFVCELSAFATSFNQENARLSRPASRAITTAQLASVVKLIDAYGSELVGMLLLAFGYASIPWIPTGEDGDTSTSDEAVDPTPAHG